MSKIIRGLIVIAALCAFYSCNSGSKKVMIIDDSNPREAILDDIATNIVVLPVTRIDSTGLGNISYSKACSNLMFLFDFDAQKIPCVIDEGLRICTWKHQDIGAFTFNYDRHRLDIFEKGTNKLKSSQMMDSLFVEEHQFDCRIKALEWIKGDTYLLVREGSESPAMVLYDIEDDEIVDSIDLQSDQAEAMTDISISRIGLIDNVYVAVPGDDNTVYSVTKNKISPAFKFRMKSGRTSEMEGWKSFPYMYIESEDTRSFYYNAGGQSGSGNLDYMNLCVIRDKETYVYKSLKLKGIGNKISPLGVFLGKYVALIKTAGIEYSGEETGDAAKKIKRAQKDGAEYVIVEYSFND